MKTLKNLATHPKFLLLATTGFGGLTIVIDQLLKVWASRLTAPVALLGVRFFPVGNSGIFGGYLADLDPWIIRIFFSVLFGFLAVGVALAIYFLRYRPTPWFKFGLVVYVSGVFGNVWDRMTTGSVVDYAVFGLPGLSSMAFNFADGVVFLGALLIAFSVFKEADFLWYAKNQRSGYWIDSEFQREIGIWFVLLGFAHFLVIAVYSFVFLKVFVSGVNGVTLPPDRVIRDYLFGLCVLEGAAMVLTFAGSVIFSHRLVGPLVAFSQFVDRRKRAGISSPLPSFRVRRSDFFRKILESIADRLEND